MRYIPLNGSDHAPLPGAYSIGRLDPSTVIQVTVRVKSRGKGLESFLYELASRLPRERRHLDREAFAVAHGADPTDIAKVERFAQQQGLTVVNEPIAQITKTSPLALRTMDLRGTVAAFSRAFNVRLFIYRYSRGIYRGYTGPISVPEELHGIVEAIFGIDNRPQARPHFRRFNHQGGAWPHPGSVSYTPNQVAMLYNFPTTVSGQKQCIAIIELGGGYRFADLNRYFQKLNIPTPKISSLSIGGAFNLPTGNPNGPDGEVMLDIEVAGAIAPGAQIVVYFAPNTSRGFFQAINAAIHDNLHKPSVISISWGGPEASWTPLAMNAFTQAFQAAAAMGVTVCCASGDGGASDGVRGRIAHVDFPASSPFVLACGGTRLESSGNSIAAETVWNDGPLPSGATGGGISDFFTSVPSWQIQANVPQSVNPGNRLGRGVPDVSGNADPASGYSVRVDRLDLIIGGTGAVAPLWAALIALMNESLGYQVGFLNPLLYSQITSNPGIFRDITQGSNDNTGQIGGYQASSGWDACTGLGSPNGAALIAALQGEQTTSPGPSDLP